MSRRPHHDTLPPAQGYEALAPPHPLDCLAIHPSAFPSLRELHLGECIRAGQTLRLSQLIGVLNACVSLEVFAVRGDALDAVLVDISQDSGPIAVLPRLRKVSIIGKAEQVSHLLAHMEIQHDVDIWLETNEEEDVSRAAAAARDILPSNPSRRNLGVLHTATRVCVHAGVRGDEGVLMVTAIDGDDLKHRFNFFLSVPEKDIYGNMGTASDDARNRYFVRALRLLGDIFPSSPVETLVCDGECAQVSEEVWGSLFTSFPMLKTLAIEDTIADGELLPLFRALNNPRFSGSTQYGVPCPSLQYLWLCNVSEEVVSPDSLEQIEKWLEWRISQGAPLQRLRLESRIVVPSFIDLSNEPYLSVYRAHFERLVPESNLSIEDRGRKFRSVMHEIRVEP